MSTKIYTGFRLPALSVEGALSRLGALREPLEALCNEAHRRVVAHRVADMLDKWAVQRMLDANALLSVEPTVSVLSAVTSKLLEQQTTCRGGMRRFPEVDCDVTLALYVDPTSRRVLGLVQQEQVRAHEFLTVQNGVADWSFWDNSDPASNVTSREWGQRADSWNRAFGAPTRITMPFQPTVLYPTPGAEHYPSWDARVAQAAKDLGRAEFFKKAEAGGGEEDLGISGLRLFFVYADALEDPHSPQSWRLDELKAEVARVLFRDLADVAQVPTGSLPPLPAR